MNATKCGVLPLVILCALFIAGPKAEAASAGQARANLALDSLTVLGHATVKIKTAEGKIIYIDPFQPGDYGDSADVVLVTHQHSDHNQVKMVKRKPDCVAITNFEAIQNKEYQRFTIGNIEVEAVAAYNANHPKSSCVGYVVEFDGIKLYHAGDTGNIPEMADLAARNITYALLPMDGIYTMSPEEATQAAVAIGATYNIPIHTMPPPDTLSEDIVARFAVPNKIAVKDGQSIALQSAATAVEETQDRPSTFALGQNYPNPFNPSSTIRYSLPQQAAVSLTIYNALGQFVTTLVNETQDAGFHEIRFNAGDLPSGIYFYRLKAGSLGQTRRLVLLR